MKLQILCPTAPPDVCGVADHSEFLAHALHSAGHDAQVISARHLEGSSLLRRLAEEAVAGSPDAILIQYTPYLYSFNRFGSNPCLPGWLSQLRLKSRVPVVLLAHELHYPVSPSPRGLLIGLPQWAQFRALVRRADATVFTYAPARDRSRVRGPSTWLPVGSNIPVAPEIAGMPSDELRLLHFGSGHPTQQLELALAAFAGVLEDQGPDSARFIQVGMSPEAFSHRVQAAGFSHLDTRICARGTLPAEKVSTELARADMVLSPFLDGVSTRRGTLMAALAHGRPVVTTLGPSSGAEVDWSEFCRTASDAPGFVEAVRALAVAPVERTYLAAAAASRYRESFSWERIAERLVDFLTSAVRR